MIYLDLYKHAVEAYFAPVTWMYDFTSEMYFKTVLLPIIEAK